MTNQAAHDEIARLRLQQRRVRHDTARVLLPRSPLRNHLLLISSLALGISAAWVLL